MAPLKHGPWNLTDLATVPKNGLKVFSCFHCGGGSTMGYKLAGFDVLGGVEIDPQMMKIYRKNHQPMHSFLMGVQEFNKIPRHEIHEDLFKLDILDGSPPCSSFSMAGARDKDWGKKKKFKEGQASQVLDDLFFHFIETARMLQPKVIIAENVKGLVTGKAKGYVKQIAQGFSDAGYDLQLFLLNSAFMGVPQRRERTVFIAKKKSLDLPKLELNFREPTISISRAIASVNNAGQKIKMATPESAALWRAIKPGEDFGKAHARGSRFNEKKLDPNMPARCLAANSPPWHWDSPRRLTGAECARMQTFPEDYDFMDQPAHYVCGMSVPPFMMQRIALQVQSQWFQGTDGLVGP